MPAVSASLPMPGPGGVAKAAKLVGPPPKTKPAGSAVEALHAQEGEEPVDPLNPDPTSPTSVAMALTQQSAAITALVAHLTTGDAMAELSSSSSAGPSLNTRGVARREKMQMELSMRTSSFFLQVQQQLFRRMNPTKPIPASEADLAAAGVSMTDYLERYGGYRGNRETGLVLWILAHAMDAFAAQDVHGGKEYLALLAAALEQSAMDNSWLGICIMPPRGSPKQPFCRSHGSDCKWSSICTAGAASMVGNSPQLPKGSRPFVIEKAGDQKSKGCPTKSRTCRPRESKAQGPSQVSQKAEGRCRGKLSVVSGGGHPGHISGDRFPQKCMSKVVPDDDDGAVVCMSSLSQKKEPKPKDSLRDHSFSCMQQMSYPRWCALLVSQVLRCRTPFAAFVSKTIQLSRRLSHRGSPAPTFFPIPLPPADFGRMPASISSARRHRIHLARTVHLVCMALNFWHSGGVFADDVSLQRSPNKQHLTLFERVKALIRSDGSSEVFDISQTGRKFPNLVARLGQLKVIG